MAGKERTLDILAVGLGRGGGRLAGELARRGYRAICFHTSKKAMEEQKHIPEERRSFIGTDSRAHTGGDPAVGRALIRDHARRIENAVRIEGKEADLILVAAGLGGGTGSAIGDFLESFDRDIAPTVALVTLPSGGQPAQRKTHALRAVQQLTQAELQGMVLIDDGRLAEKESSLSVLDFYNRVNEQVVDPLDALNRLDSREDLSPVRGIQANRLQQILTRGGVLAYGVRDVKDLDLETIGEAVMGIVADGEVVAGELDPGTIGTMQIALVAPKAVLENTPVRLVEALREHWKSQSPGASVDVAIYRAEDDAPCRVHAVASCASLPTRLEDMVDQTAEEAAAWRSKACRPPVLDLGRLDDLDDPATGSFRSGDHEPPPRASSPPPRASSPPPSRRPSSAPSASASSPPPSISSPPSHPPVADDDGEEQTNVASEPRSSAEGSTSGPGKAVFARLVTRYKSSTNPELQRAIARRLEQDRLSEDPRIRLLAVDAMGKIGAHVFDGALFAATEDENEEVRSAAEAALASANPTRTV